MDTTNSEFRLSKGQFQEEEAPRFSPRRLGALLFTLAVLIALSYGWANRHNSYLSASEGWGYILGIVGGSLMLLLLLYPLRKNLRFMHHWGPIRFWFRTHMIFGIVGPVLILYHSNFHLGSTNSNLALFCMLIVAGSGLIGRYFYTKIHFGLYGHVATLEELRKDLKITRGNLGAHTRLSPRIVELMKSYEILMLKKRVFVIQLMLLPVTHVRSRWLLWRIKRTLKRDMRALARKYKWNRHMLHEFIGETLYLLREYFLCVRKTGQLTMYARLFSLWHVLHMPLFIMLVITGIIHVFAVHMY